MRETRVDGAPSREIDTSKTPRTIVLDAWVHKMACGEHPGIVAMVTVVDRSVWSPVVIPLSADQADLVAVNPGGGTVTITIELPEVEG